jgi:hypothetical protein
VLENRANRHSSRSKRKICISRILTDEACEVTGSPSVEIRTAPPPWEAPHRPRVGPCAGASASSAPDSHSHHRRPISPTLAEFPPDSRSVLAPWPCPKVCRGPAADPAASQSGSDGPHAGAARRRSFIGCVIHNHLQKRAGHLYWRIGHAIAGLTKVLQVPGPPMIESLFEGVRGTAPGRWSRIEPAPAI